MLFLGSQLGVQTSLPVMRQKTSLNSSQCREIRAYFESRRLGVHYLRQQTQGPSYIPIAYRNLLLRCDWKVGILSR